MAGFVYFKISVICTEGVIQYEVPLSSGECE